MRSLRLEWIVSAVLLTAGAAGGVGACSSSEEQPLSSAGDAGGEDASVVADSGEETTFELDAPAVDPDAAALAIEPIDKVLDVTVGAAVPTLAFVAKASGTPVAVAWSLDRGELGSIDATGLFTPTGTLGGKATVTATYGSKKATTSVTVRLKMTQNGGSSGGGDAGVGSGGAGGVGGEGPGGPIDITTKATFDEPPVADAKVKWLYPYDKTVWPRGILAPLLQWDPGPYSFDAVKITIKESAFEYVGTFAKTASPFLHHPVPQDVWKKLTYSNGGEPVTVELTFAAGGKIVGPIKESWIIAKGPLKGTVYYDSYGTKLAENYYDPPSGTRFGGATLAIKGGSTDPTLVAGGTGSEAKCRVCHSVAANGSTLLTQWGDNYAKTGAFDLKTAGYPETALAPADGRFTYAGLYPDGAMLFSNSSPSGAPTVPSGLYSVPSGAAIATTGLPTGLQAALPSFSPDGKHVSFGFYGGADSDRKSLAAMDFDVASMAFSSLVKLHTPTSGTAVWSSWLPTSDGVLFQLETVSNGRDFAGTRSQCDASGACSNIGTHGEIWWVDPKTKSAARLDQLNGRGYLPTGPNAHDDDATLNYQPSVSPVVSGGYAWVVFVSRRLYGNVATINPYWSDPRFHDISKTPTTKKLWVAAIDLGAPPGTDPSHPAFYLPGQELLAGNSHGYWVVDPCKAESASCETGDECCGGFCQKGEGGALTCTNKPPVCAAEYEKCEKDADCCGIGAGVKCLGGRCAESGPK